MKMELKEKVEHAKNIIKEAIEKNPKIAVACSFGKDSMVVVHIARQVKPDIPIFSIMTPYKPKESFSYIKEMDKKLGLNVIVHFAGDEIPEDLKFLGDRLIMYKDLHEKAEKYYKELKENLKNKFNTDVGDLHMCKLEPSLCCDLYKTEVTKRAIKDLDAWICGLRKDEGTTRIDYKEVEYDKGLIKINPILNFTEEEVLGYLKEKDIPLHPWYYMRFPDGKRYRSLGCALCTVPIHDDEKERAGRWVGSSKCGGECGIHTQSLK